VFEKLLLAVDGSKAGEVAIDAAAGLAKISGADVFVVTVEGDSTRATEPERLAKATKLVDDIVARFAQLGIAAAGEVLPTHDSATGCAIVDAARHSGCDTIVIGSRGLTEAKALLLGSVAHDVIQQFHGRVLVAR
jgi:nucleotide-binding universal stress UspA family protein